MQKQAGVWSAGDPQTGPVRGIYGSFDSPLEIVFVRNMFNARADVRCDIIKSLDAKLRYEA